MARGETLQLIDAEACGQTVCMERAVACLWQAAQDGALSSARHGADRQGGARACCTRRGVRQGWQGLLVSAVGRGGHAACARGGARGTAPGQRRACSWCTRRGARLVSAVGRASEFV